MSDSILTIIACGLIPIVLVIGIAIIGTLKRIRFANRLMEEIKKGRFEDFSEMQNKKRIRLLALFSMISIIGILTITIMIITNILALPSSSVLIVYIILVSLGVFSSVALYNDVIRKIK
jgi:uncharacterized membrane protein YjgN (DUF898 family)